MLFTSILLFIIKGYFAILALMIKNAVAPIQAWLLSQGRCVGCGMPLAKASSSKKGSNTHVACKCGRIYVKTGGTYRRALLSEVK